MEISKAMEIIGISEIAQITEKQVKSIFRSKIRRAHPDLGGSEDAARELIKAYEILIDSAKRLEECIKTKDVRDNIAIELDQLMSVYSGNTLKVVRYGATETIELNRSNLSNIRVLLLIPYKLIICGNAIVGNYSVMHNSKDAYDMDIKVDNVKAEIGDKAILSIGDSVVDLDIVSKQMMVAVRLEYNITIKVRISLSST